MSADLLAAFGSETQSGRQELLNATNNGKREEASISGKDRWSPQLAHREEPKSARQHPFSNTRQQKDDNSNLLFDADSYEVGTVTQNDDGDDDFGEFELVKTTPLPTSSARSTAQTENLIDLGIADISSTLQDQLNFSAHNPPASATLTRAVTSNRAVSSTEPAFAPKQAFEVDDENNDGEDDEDDEWGQFEDVDSPDLSCVVKREGQNSIGTELKLGNSNPPAAGHQEAAAADQTIGHREDQPDDGFDDSWDHFDDEESDIFTSVPSKTDETRQGLFTTSTKLSETRADRPTNVPPPGVLLNLLSQIFQHLFAQAGETPKDEIGIKVLQAYQVCARIISGRHLRWKRDNILAQSTRIGVAGRSGGMKLTSLDKSETRREEQEAQETIASWSRLSHKLNSAMLKAKVTKPSASLSTNLTVRIVSGADILISNHICPVCGLKRNERINGVDISVADIFGEFWIDHWGHTDCHEIWYAYNYLLEQR